MPPVAALVEISPERPSSRPVSDRLHGPAAALSVASARVASLRPSLLGAMAFHGLILAVLLQFKPTAPVIRSDAVAPEVIEVVTVPLAEPDPAPPVESAVADVSEPPDPLPTTEAPEPPLVEAPTLEEPVPPPAPPPPSEVPPAPVTPPPEATAPASITDVTPPPASPPRVLASRAKLPRATAHGAVAGQAVGTVVAPQARAAGGSENRPAGDALTSRIRNAVQAAVQCPPAARMMGQSGKAAVAFDYRDGAVVGGLQVARSSGTPVLDTAALTAVRRAHYPPAPSDQPDQVLHLLIWVDEACNN